MKNVMKTATLESKFPLLAVENGCIISKDADVYKRQVQSCPFGKCTLSYKLGTTHHWRCTL